jgi:hypothetical protein
MKDVLSKYLSYYSREHVGGLLTGLGVGCLIGRVLLHDVDSTVIGIAYAVVLTVGASIQPKSTNALDK